MRSLVVYYSRTGNTKKVAEEISKNIGADLEEVIDTEDRLGILGYMRAGRDAFTGKLTVIKQAVNNPSTYDVVIVGTPIWAFTVSTPVRTYLNQNKGNIKNVAFYCTNEGAGGERAFRAMQEICGKRPVAVLNLTKKEVFDGKIKGKIREFISKIVG